MKIFAYVGSSRGKESQGYKYISRVCEEMKRCKPDIDFSIYSDRDLNILPHSGEIIDFINVKSVYEDDDMAILEKEMLESDVIIWISPVYAHNVSSQMKKFIDRVSYWLHILRLTGKMGYIVSVSDSNGNDYVTSYMREVMQFLGLYVIGETNLVGEKIKKNSEIYESYVLHTVHELLSAEDMNEFDFPYEQEKYFESQKKRYLNADKELKERCFWDENGYFDYEIFEDLFLSKYQTKLVASVN